MKRSDLYCVGFPPQPPHVPNHGGLIAILDGRGAQLCSDCWRRWRISDNDGTTNE